MHSYVFRCLLKQWTIAAHACTCSVFNYIPDRHGRETRAALVGNDLLHERAGSFVHFLHLIHRRNISFNPLDWLIADELFDEVSAQVSQQPNSKLDRNVNLKRKRQCKIWRFSWPKPVVSLCCCSLTPKQLNYVIIGLVYPRTKPWTIYTSSSRLM